MRPVFLISIPAVQKVFNRITDASAQRLVDKVRPRGYYLGSSDMWLILKEPEEEESRFSFLLSELTDHAIIDGFLTHVALT